MSLIRARELAIALGKWAACNGRAEPENLRWAVSTANTLVNELMRLEEAAVWSLPGHPFAYAGGARVHVRDCFYVDQSTRATGHRPLTPGEAEAFLRESHEHRRCMVCAPDIPEPLWVRRQIGGRVRWLPADHVDPGEVL